MQTPDENRELETGTTEAPAKLVAALKQAARPRVFIPPTVDQTVLRAANRHLAPPEKPRLAWLRLTPWFAGAAAVLLLFATLAPWQRKPGSTDLIALEDLNHDGQVDILDAFALARQLKSGAKPGPQMDMNGDGVVDDRDVALIAAHAVSLQKGGPS
jgi:hypothetical protein